MPVTGAGAEDPPEPPCDPIIEVALTDGLNRTADSIFSNAECVFPAEDQTLTVEIYSSAGASEPLLTLYSVPTDGEGSFWVGPADTNGLNLVDGMYVTVTGDASDHTEDLVLADVTFDPIIPGANQVSGTAPEGTAEVWVEVGNDAVSFAGIFPVNPNGSWSVAAPAEFVIDAYMGGTVSLPDEDNDGTSAGIPAHNPTIEVALTDELSAGADTIFACCGEGFTLDPWVTVRIYDVQGGSLFGSPVRVATDIEGSFWVGPADTNGLNLVDGMYVTVTGDYTGKMKALVLAAIAVDDIDPVSDIVTGTAPAGAGLWVYVGNDYSVGWAFVEADGSNRWSATAFESEDPDFDIQPGMGATIHLTDDDADTTRAGIPVAAAPWTMVGFYQPVDMGGIWNVVKGGSTVPLKFEVFDGETEITDPGTLTFTVTPVTCPDGAATDAIEVLTTGATSIRYDWSSGQFIQNWKTPKRPGACWQVGVEAADGASLWALFQLR